MSTPSNPPSRLDLELWALGELEGADRAALEARIAADPELAARAERVRDEIQAATADLPPLPDLPEVSEEPPDNVVPLFARPAVRAALALAAAALLAVLAWPFLADGPDPGTRFRGALDLEVYRVRLGEPVPQDAIVRAREGDRIQYTVTSPVDGYLQVFDLQDDGALATWLPSTPAPALRPVTGAAVLDDYPGSERIFFVVSPVPVGEAAVRESLSRAFSTPLAELDTLPGFGAEVRQRSILVVEDATP